MSELEGDAEKGSPPSEAPSPTDPPRSRTATAGKPPGYPFSHPRIRRWWLYSASSIFFLSTGAELLIAWCALLEGPRAWSACRVALQHPALIVYHTALLAMTLWFGGRTYFVLFARTQPARIGPVRRPPLWVFPPTLAALWIGSTGTLVAILWGISV